MIPVLPDHLTLKSVASSWKTSDPDSSPLQNLTLRIFERSTLIQKLWYQVVTNTLWKPGATPLLPPTHCEFGTQTVWTCNTNTIFGTKHSWPTAFLETVFYTLLETDVAVLASSSIFSSEKCQVPGGSLIFGRQPGEFVDPGWPGESRPLTHVETGQEMVSTNVLPEGLFVKLNAIIEQDLSKQRLHQVKSVPYEGQTSGIFL